MNIRDIVLLIVVCIMIYQLYSKQSIEKFEQDQVKVIRDEINRQYNMDIESIRNLGAISKSLLSGTNYHTINPTNPGTLTIPADTIIEGNNTIKGDFVVDGNLSFTNRNTMLMDIFPSGMVLAWTNKEIPSGWVRCDGLNNTPDLRGRFILGDGAGDDLTNRELNNKGGTEDHTLSINEMPSHSHKIYRSNHKVSSDYLRKKSGYNVSAITVGDGGDRNIYPHPSYWSNDPDNSSLYIHESGGDQPHNNMPPFYVLIYIMKL